MGAGKDAGSRGPCEGPFHAATGTRGVSVGCWHPQPPRNTRAAGTLSDHAHRDAFVPPCPGGCSGAAGPAGPLAPHAELALSPGQAWGQWDNSGAQRALRRRHRHQPGHLLHPGTDGMLAPAKQGTDAHRVPRGLRPTGEHIPVFPPMPGCPSLALTPLSLPWAMQDTQPGAWGKMYLRASHSPVGHAGDALTGCSGLFPYLPGWSCFWCIHLSMHVLGNLCSQCHQPMGLPAPRYTPGPNQVLISTVKGRCNA